MKTILITISFMFLFGACRAQETETSDTTVYDAVDQEPVPVGGLAKFYAYLGKSIRLTDTLRKDVNVQTALFIEFIVEKDGSISHARILKDTSPSTGKSAIESLSRFPKWTPGSLQGRTVRVRYRIKSIIELQMEDK
ncbi:MAG: energy transducer TonB [Bacteroidetes bacterium]|nr:energy transducer TonB [Bacteroidota bacterium]